MANSIGLHLQGLLSNYQPPTAAISLLNKTRVLLIVGITGAGKDTIKHELLEHYPQIYHHVVSHTTRQPRYNKGVLEQNGLEYHFIDSSTAETMLNNRAFVEAKIYSDNLYGTSLAEFQLAHDEGKIALTDLEVQGVSEYVAIAQNLCAVFVLPPSYQVWQQRTMQRYGNEIDSHHNDLQKRYQTAAAELEFALSADFFNFIINDALDESVAKVHEFATTPQPPQQDEAAIAVAHELLARIKASL